MKAVVKLRRALEVIRIVQGTSYYNVRGGGQALQLQVIRDVQT